MLAVGIARDVSEILTHFFPVARNSHTDTQNCFERKRQANRGGGCFGGGVVFCDLFGVHSWWTQKINKAAKAEQFFKTIEKRIDSWH